MDFVVKFDSVFEKFLENELIIRFQFLNLVGTPLTT